AMSIPQLLAGQRRAEVRVLAAQDRQDLLGDGALECPVAGSIAVPGDQSHRSLGSIPDHQSFDLPNAQSEAVSRSAWPQFPSDDRLDRLEPLEVLHGSCNSRVAAHSQAPKSLTDLGKHGPEPETRHLYLAGTRHL